MTNVDWCSIKPTTARSAALSATTQKLGRRRSSSSFRPWSTCAASLPRHCGCGFLRRSKRQQLLPLPSRQRLPATERVLQLSSRPRRSKPPQRHLPIRNSMMIRPNRSVRNWTTKLTFESRTADLWPAQQPEAAVEFEADGRGSDRGHCYHEQTNNASGQSGQAAAGVSAADRARAMLRVALDPEAGRLLAEAALHCD